MTPSTIAADNKQVSISHQLLFDLTQRARSGIYIYLAFWVLTTTWADIHHNNPVSFYLNSFLFISVGGFRLVHYYLVTRSDNYNATFMHRCLIGLILFNALHLGLLSAWIIQNSNYPDLHYPFIIIIGAVTIAGTTIFGISLLLSIMYPIFSLLPTFIVFLSVGDGESIRLAILSTFTVFYCYEASRASRHDYWKAVYSRKEADDRAVLLEVSNITDPLTKVYNRIYFDSCYSSEWLRCYNQQQPLSVVMIDLDHFKKINDTYGHFAGDKCLKEVALALKKELKRSSDVIARYGGEEFMVLLPNVDLATATSLAKGLLRAVSDINLIWNQETIKITCSIGVASTLPATAKASQKLLMAADDAMYKAKESGRNQYSVVAKMESKPDSH